MNLARVGVVVLDLGRVIMEMESILMERRILMFRHYGMVDIGVIQQYKV